MKLISLKILVKFNGILLSNFNWLTKYHPIRRSVSENIKVDYPDNMLRNDNVNATSNPRVHQRNGNVFIFMKSSSLAALEVVIMMTSSNGNIFHVSDPLCGEFTDTGEYRSQRPVTRNFAVFFDLRLNKRLSKQSWGWWFETPSRSLWRHCNHSDNFHNSLLSHWWKFHQNDISVSVMKSLRYYDAMRSLGSCPLSKFIFLWTLWFPCPVSELCV